MPTLKGRKVRIGTTATTSNNLGREFYLFSSFRNFKTYYGAIGNDSADDTAALQNAFNDLATGAHYTLYIPDGTYALTSEVLMSAKRYINIYGASPLTTKLKWQGANTTTAMIRLNGVSYSNFGRIHYDANGANNITLFDHDWDGVTGFASTHHEHADSIFTGGRIGLQFGKRVSGIHYMDAEVKVARCSFNQNVVGVMTDSFNALDIWIWDSQYNQCTVGVNNNPSGGGAGNFNVYQSIFRGSTYADIESGQSGFYSSRYNYSIGSNMHFATPFVGSNGQQVTLQKNVILDPLQRQCINIDSEGQVCVIDNIIRLRGDATDGPVVRCNGDVLSIGNQFTVADNISGEAGRVESIDDLIVSRASISIGEPTLEGTPALVVPPQVYELSNSSTDASFAAALTWAAARIGQKPIIHITPASYNITSTVVVPESLDVQIIGDGIASKVNWMGANNGVMFRIYGYKRLELFELNATNGSNRATCFELHVENALGKMLYMDGCITSQATGVGVKVNGLSSTVVENHCLDHKQNALSIDVINSIMRMFTWAGSNNILSYNTQSGGDLLVTDGWYEGSPTGYVNFASSGNFSLSGGRLFSSDPTTPLTQAPIIVDNYQGKVLISQLNGNHEFVVKGDGSGTKVMGNGINFVETPSPYLLSSPSAQVGMLNNRYSAPSTVIANTGDTSDVFVLEMYSHLRSTLPLYKTSSLAFYMRRVSATNSINGFDIRPLATGVGQMNIGTSFIVD